MIVKILIRTLAVMVTAQLIPGITVTDFWSGAAAAIVLGLLNSLLRPVLLVLTLPVNILTLGLFTLVLNTLMILLAARIVPGFDIKSFAAAFWFGVVLSIVNWFLNKTG